MNESTLRCPSRAGAVRLLVAWSVVVLPGLCRCPEAAAEIYRNSHAVVVGVDRYQTSAFPPLRYATSDAGAFAEYLSDQGFAVKIFYDHEATRIAILSYLYDDLAPRLGPDDRVLFFFAGHGTTEEVAGDRWGYIVPWDGSLSASWISMEDLRMASARMKTAKHQLFVLVSCFGGLLGATRGAQLVETDTPLHVRDIATRPARQILTAGGEDQIVRDGGGEGKSLFMEALLQGLDGGADRDRDGYITTSELAGYMLSAASAGGQTPLYSILPGHGGGEFVFRAPGGSVELEPRPTARPGPKVYLAMIRHPAKLRNEPIRIDGAPAEVVDRNRTEALVEIAFSPGDRSKVIDLGERCRRVVSEETDFSKPISLCQDRPWRFLGGVSTFTFEPALPPALVAHETHPDDRELLAGDAGTTVLDSVEVTFLDMSVERIVPLGSKGGINLKIAYGFKLPLMISGRLEKQNENDPRPAREGSFIYSEIDDVAPVHELGLGLVYETSDRLRWVIEPALHVGYWSLAFSKGWDRFGSNETALAVEANGLGWSPQLVVRREGRVVGASLRLGFRSLILDYEGHRGREASGWEAQLALTTRVGASP